MAKICMVICTSHSPYLHLTPEEWTTARRLRDLPGAFSSDVPEESEEENRAKHSRCMRAFKILGTQLEEARPDILLVFGDDQLEQFSFNNFPAFAIFVGEAFEGYKISPYYGVPLPGQERKRRERNDASWTRVQGHPKLGQAILTGLMDRGFDPAFCHDLDDKDEGIGHAFMRPSHYMRPSFDLPILPIFINCYYGPQPSGMRCYQFGRSIAEIIAAYPEDLRVAVIGSGGLWHTPLYPEASIDAEFDRTILETASRGNAGAMAEYFDSRTPVVDDMDAGAIKLASGGTGIVTGLSSGTGETRNWIAASATVDGQSATIVDYVPIHASPIGVAFAYWQCDS